MTGHIATEFPLHKAFLIFGLIFGLIWLVLLPPFQGPDELAHFGRAYMISQGNIGPVNSQLPVSIRNLEEVLQSGNMRGHSDVKHNPDRMAVAAKIEIRPQDTIFYSEVAYTYPPVAYLPAAAGTAAARVLDMPILYVFYCARIAGFLFFLFAMYLLIKNVRILKLPLLTIALTPMVVQQGSIVTADGVTILLIISFAVYVLNVTFDAKKQFISKNDIAIMSLLSVALALSKGPYVLIGLLFLIIPRKKFNRPYLYWGGCACVISAGLAAALVWQYLISAVAIPIALPASTAPGPDAAPMGPFRVISKLADTLFSMAFWKSAFWLGWRDVRLPLVFLIGFFALMIWPCFISDEEKSEGLSRARWPGFFVLTLTAGILISNAVMMCLVLPQKPSGKIIGMEGRYYIRLLFPFVAAVYLIIPDRVRIACSHRLENKEFWVKAHIGLLFALLVGATAYIFARYYV